jgi:zinc transport system substrate-binding protein
VHHPAFGHFAVNFGLRQLSIEEEGKEPTPRRLQAVVAQAKKEHVRIVITQPQFDFREARLVAQALDAKLVVVNDLDYDVFDTIRKLGRILSGALGDCRGT